MGRLPAAIFILAMCMPCMASAETRIALVIGNSEYASGPLPNPANDAKMIAETLGKVGFEVISRRNADQITMKRAIQEFGARLDKAGAGAVGLFYYAGHGVQLNGRNYLIPTTAQIEREGDVEIEAVSADWVIEQMKYARNRLNIVILDACRNNPFPHSMRAMNRGLATMEAPAGILIAYSTSPGEVAMDGEGSDSPYTKELSLAMRNMHEPVEQVFKKVRIGVMGATGNKQIPWEASSLTGDFYFSAPPVEAPPPTLAAEQPSPPRSGGAAATTAEKPAAGSFGSLLSNFFGGADKKPAETPPADQSTAKPIVLASLPVQQVTKETTDAAAGAAAAAAMVAGAKAFSMLQSLGVESNEIDPLHNYPQAAVRHVVETSARHVTVGNTQQQIQAALALCRKYGSDCKFEWFSDENVRSATLDPFDMDATPVSVQAFRRFVEATAYKTEAEKVGHAYAHVGQVDSIADEKVEGGTWRNGIKKRIPAEDSAVIGVSFQDAVAYCHWKGQRLPTENEWEYLARGPERQTFPWGENVAPAVATLNSPPRVSDGPAEGIGGRYRGLSGNVWQWVDSKVDGHRVLKGGSWLETNPALKRAASRRYDVSTRADEDSGFRCAKTLTAWPDAELWLARLK